MQLNFLPIPCYIFCIFTMSFCGNYYKLGKHRQLTSKHSENVPKTKMGISVFLNTFIFKITYCYQLFVVAILVVVIVLFYFIILGSRGLFSTILTACFTIFRR